MGRALKRKSRIWQSVLAKSLQRQQELTFISGDVKHPVLLLTPTRIKWSMRRIPDMVFVV